MKQDYKGTGGNRRQHPCSNCGTEIPADDCYDLLLEKRRPRADRQGGTKKTRNYLPPRRFTTGHIYLCNECAKDFVKFMNAIKEGAAYYDD